MHMIREWFTADFDVVHYRMPWFQRKYYFADKLAKDWELNLHVHYPPSGFSVLQSEGTGAEVVHHYQQGANSFMVRLEKQSTDRQVKWLCARHDIITQSTASVPFRWDVAFLGARSPDPKGLAADINQSHGSCDFAFPLRHFTDADIWAMHEQWAIPYDTFRHKKQEDGSYLEDAQSIFRSGAAPYCADCLDCGKPSVVTCPKSNLEVGNISGQFLRVNSENLNYIKT